MITLTNASFNQRTEEEYDIEVTNIESLKEASDGHREYIERNNLGASNCIEGEVRVNGRLIAKVSYNGRVWTAENRIEIEV